MKGHIITWETLKKHRKRGKDRETGIVKEENSERRGTL